MVDAAWFLSWSRLALSDVDAGAGDARVVLERPHDLLRFADALPVEIGDLRLELLDARVVVEERRRLLSELRAQRRRLLRQAAQQFGIDEVRRFDRLSGLDHDAQQAGFGIRFRFLRSRDRELGIEFAELLVGQRGVVGSDEEVRARAEFLDLGFGFGHLLAQRFDLAGKPLACDPGLIELGRLLQAKIGVRDGVRDLGRELGIGPIETQSR